MASESQVPFGGRPIEQVAYYVPDVEAAARQHSAQFGSGPWFKLPRVASTGEYRGTMVEYETEAVFGQWGAVMVEFLTQTGGQDTVMNELHRTRGTYGLHHMSYFVDDLDAEVARLKGLGFEAAFRGNSARLPGFRFAFIDAISTLGHFLEVYEPLPRLVQLFDQCRRAAQGFDGTNLIRDLDLRQ